MRRQLDSGAGVEGVSEVINSPLVNDLKARRSDIMMQFNTEALVVGALGGVIGVLIGLGVSLALSATGMSVAITPTPAMLAFGSALAIGLLFGFMPARKAARLDPVIALASE